MLFLRSVITPRPTEGNVEDPDFSNIFATGAQFQEEADAYESDSESAQASSCERNETFDNRNSRGMLSKKLQNSFTDVAGPINATFSPRSKKRKGQPTTTSANFEKELLDIESKKLSLLRGKFGKDDEDMNFFKSLMPHVKQLPFINKLNFRSQVQNILVHELSTIESNQHPQATPCQRSPSSASSSPFMLSPAVP
ncbi:hypothetical protein L798_11361 [Zootermopsis nevadensis]|uniref:BESS domain-containing protein n=1 Tax=Zootermopsis nevadensis TaxID=136037 RepID=A0A067RIU7_ZOONE|nr:hypothetical protein L798_11361 [Zootermopsis nevadensis]